MNFGFLGAGAVSLLVALVLVSIGVPAWSADNAGQLKRGRDLFSHGANPGCPICHSLKDAGAEGMVGPSLDQLKPDTKRVITALRDGIGQMPSYRETLTDEQIAALAAYVSKASGASK